MIDLAFLGAYTAGLGVNSVNLCAFYIDVGELMENPSQREAHIIRRQLRRSNLIEERLKLMVVMLVHERNMDFVIARQLLRACDSGESTADDHYILFP